MHCYWGVAVPRPTEWTQLKNISMYIQSSCVCVRVHTYRYMYTYYVLIYSYIHPFFLSIPSTINSHYYLPFQLNATGLIPVFLQFSHVLTFSNSEKPSSYYVYCIYLLDQSSLYNTNLVLSLCGHPTHLTKASISGVGGPPTQMPSSPDSGSDMTHGTTLPNK